MGLEQYNYLERLYRFRCCECQYVGTGKIREKILVIKYEKIIISQTDKVVEYDIVRALLMLLVVLGHCTYYQISTNYGGAYYQDLMLQAGVNDTLIHRIASWVTSAIYTFHMPLFMALSGAVFSLQLSKGKYEELMLFIKNKFRRLLLPFLLTALFVSIPLKYFSGYWEKSDGLIWDIVIGQLLLQGNTHLWFLPTLFCEMIIFWVLYRYTNWLSNKAIYMVVILSLMHLLIKSPLGIFTYVVKFGIWFYVGMLFNEYRQDFNNVASKHKVIATGIIFLILFIIEHILAGGDGLVRHGLVRHGVHRVAAFATAIVGMWLFYSSCYCMWKNNIIRETKWISFLSINSMGIYLYSDPLNYTILSWFYHTYSICAFGNEVYAFLLYIGRFVVTFTVASIMTIAVRIVIQNFKRKILCQRTSW